VEHVLGREEHAIVEGSESGLGELLGLPGFTNGIEGHKSVGVNGHCDPFVMN
jgi:hypothetical protein